MLQTTLSKAVCDSANLATAFDRYRRYHGIWTPGLPMWRMSESPVFPMLKLAEQLHTGHYRPDPPKQIQIAKIDGTYRQLCVFSLRDRVAQRALLQVLQARTDAKMSTDSYGYRPGRGVGDALFRVQALLDDGFSWVVDADIEHCFERIPRELLLQEVTQRLNDTEAAEWVARLLGWHSTKARCATGIPQGAVLSPWLCNVYLWRLDDALRAKNSNSVRFADDFVLLTDSRQHAESLREYCASVVQTMRLCLHPVKTMIVEAHQPFRFLGRWLQVKPRLPHLPLAAT